MLKRRRDPDEPEEADPPVPPPPSVPPPLPSAARASSSARPPLSASDRTERRRKQCRISQRRYRDKKGSAEYNLRLDINNLRESVERLTQARALLQTKLQHDRETLTSSILKAVEQYYAMFQFGLHDPHAGAHVRKCYDIQVSFLQAFMDPQVECGGAVGVAAVLEQWRRYSRYHSAVRVALLESHVFGSDSESPIVKATGSLTVTLNRSTLEHIFPHVLADEQLAQFLIGQQVEYTTCTEYVFDEKVQVVRQDFTVDFLSGLGAVLHDPFLTAKVLKSANITHSSHLGRGDVQVKEETDDETAKETPVLRHERDDTFETSSPASSAESTAESTSKRLALQFIMS